MIEKEIASIEVINPGSPPDVDSDFNTVFREKAIEHVTDVYGEVANIITFSAYQAKGAFKALCTVYEVPFKDANKAADLIPGGCHLNDLYDPQNEFFDAGREFREFTSGSEWKAIVDGARAIEGRYFTTGMHAAGVVISPQKLEDVIPLHVRQSDHRRMSQWEYSELEELGLIKMDFLGLDTVDLIQHTVENIYKLRGEAPNMLDFIHGDMQDKKTFELLGRGETVGVFQLASDGMRDLLLRMKPTTIDDISAITALFRPGPMGMESHVKYADRKNGREKIDYIHPEFNGTALEDILGKTYGLCVYQEQVMQIANQIAGMTLQEGDSLRKAMGKKKFDVMEKMKPVFFDGARENGFSDDAITALWKTIEVFAAYGFNKAHAVAYAVMSMQTAYLKAHYPAEFMAALMNQNIRDSDKISAFLQEASRMGLRVGTVSINRSSDTITPLLDDPDLDIVYGINGVRAVSDTTAHAIVQERDRGGDFTSLQDCVERCVESGAAQRKSLENLALAGAFDEFGISRKGAVDAIPKIIESARKNKGKGESLFAAFGSEDEQDSVSIKVSDDEFSYTKMLQEEANTIGLYISGHPLEKSRDVLFASGCTPIEDTHKLKFSKTISVCAAITKIVKKDGKSGQTLLVTLDDGTGYLQTRVQPGLMKRIRKMGALNTIKKRYLDGRDDVSDDTLQKAVEEGVVPKDELEEYGVYIFDVTVFPQDGGANGLIKDYSPVRLLKDGSLPARMRVPATLKNPQRTLEGLPKALSKHFPGSIPIVVSMCDWDDLTLRRPNERAYLEAVKRMRAGEKEREWVDDDTVCVAPSSPADHREAISTLPYRNTGYTVERSQDAFLGAEKYVGAEGFDYGNFISSLESS